MKSRIDAVVFASVVADEDVESQTGWLCSMPESPVS
jgi:hypothetical protein